MAKLEKPNEKLAITFMRNGSVTKKVQVDNGRSGLSATIAELITFKDLKPGDKVLVESV